MQTSEYAEYATRVLSSLKTQNLASTLPLGLIIAKIEFFAKTQSFLVLGTVTACLLLFLANSIWTGILIMFVQDVPTSLGKKPGSAESKDDHIERVRRARRFYNDLIRTDERWMLLRCILVACAYTLLTILAICLLWALPTPETTSVTTPINPKP